MRVNKNNALFNWWNIPLLLLLLICSFGCAETTNIEERSMHKVVFPPPLEDIIKRYYSQEVAREKQKAIVNLYVEHFTDTVSFKIQATNVAWDLNNGAYLTAYSEIDGILVHIYTGLERLIVLRDNTYYDEASLYLYGRVLNKEEQEKEFINGHTLFPAWEVVLIGDDLKIKSYRTQVYNVPFSSPPPYSE